MEEELLKRLEEGNFNGVELDEWFRNPNATNLYRILATITGCDKNLDSDMLYIISMYAKHLFIKTDETKYSPVIITNNQCKTILEHIITIGTRHLDVYHETISQLMDFPNDYIRLLCCAHIGSPIYLKYLNDECARIRKVANIRQDFDTKWNEISQNKHELAQINFLVSALNKGAIKIYELYTPRQEDETVTIKFQSYLFTWNDKTIINNNLINHKLTNFDADILHTIPDKRILACIIHDWIKAGILSFKEGIKPACFETTDVKEELNNPLKKSLKPTYPGNPRKISPQEN